MSLKITTSNISIQNNAGVDKFDSDDKLAYLANSASGSTSIDLNNWQRKINLGFTRRKTDIVNVFIKITSSSGGSLSPNYHGITMPVTGALPVDIRKSVVNYQYTDTIATQENLETFVTDTQIWFQGTSVSPLSQWRITAAWPYIQNFISMKIYRTSLNIDWWVYNYRHQDI